MRKHVSRLRCCCVDVVEEEDGVVQEKDDVVQEEDGVVQEKDDNNKGLRCD